METKKEEKFLIELIDFYKDFTSASASSIRKLATIQKNYHKEYKLIAGLSENPEALNELVRILTDKQRQIFLDVMVQSASLSKKSNRLFTLNSKEQKKLAKELEDFGSKIEEFIKKLQEGE